MMSSGRLLTMRCSVSGGTRHRPGLGWRRPPAGLHIRQDQSPGRPASAASGQAPLSRRSLVTNYLPVFFIVKFPPPLFTLV